MNDGRSQLVKQVKEANDIVSVVGSYLALHPAGLKFKGICPFHDDSRPSLIVDPKWQNFKCWSCGKAGDVLTFVQEYDKVNFVEALETLARRANIRLDQYRKPEDANRLRLIDALRWAAELYQQNLLDSAAGEAARNYLGSRKLLGETVRKFGLGFAPGNGDWLARQAHKAPVAIEVLVEAGLIAPSSMGTGYYDRFRDRVMFPIRNLRNQVVGFGGRILPESPLASRAPKYYNTADSAVFNKSELIFGLDLARLAAQTAGSLAVVEGYTDVLMSHQSGVTNVVATMGTALTAEHVRQVRRFANKVVLVYDADAGGNTGVDRALELFIREDVELAVARLPEGLDPFDLLTQLGPEPFRAAIAAATNVLDYKLDQLMNRNSDRGVAADHRAVEAILAVLAMAPEAASSETRLRRDLILSRIGQRFGLNNETVRQRLAELRRRKPAEKEEPAEVVNEEPISAAPAEPLERELVEVLLADPDMVGQVREQLLPDDLRHPGLRRIVAELYELLAEGDAPDLDNLRLRLVDKPKLAEFALRAREVGMQHQDRGTWLKQILQEFRNRDSAKATVELKGQIKATTDPAAAMELLKKLQQTTVAAAAR